MELSNRKCLICKRDIKDSWDELKEHLMSRDDIPDDVREVFESKEYHGTLGEEAWFMEIPIPFTYYRHEDVELVDDDHKRDDLRYKYIYYDDLEKYGRVPKEKIKRTNLYIDLCNICATALQHIHLASNQYTDEVVSETCISQNAKLTAEIAIKKVIEVD